MVPDRDAAGWKTSRIVVFDDGPEDRMWLEDLAKQADWEDIVSFDHAEASYHDLETEDKIALQLDQKLQGCAGIVHLGAIWSRAPNASVILIAGYESQTILDLSRTLGVGFAAKNKCKVEDLA